MINLLNLINGFTLFGYDVKFYGIIIAMGMMIGIFIAVYNTKFRDLVADDVYTVALYALPMAIVGARLYYVAFSDYSYTFSQIFDLRSGGLAIYGGVIGGALGVLLFCYIHKKNFIKLADVLVISLILGQAIGRWGNFFNQEAFGNQVTNPALQWFPYAVFIEASGTWQMATFFYESFFNLIIFAALMILIRKTKLNGLITALYFVLYGLVRVVVEGFRTDSLYWEFFGTNFRVSQLLSAVHIIIGVIVIIWLVIHHKLKQQEQKIKK